MHVDFKYTCQLEGGREKKRRNEEAISLLREAWLYHFSSRETKSKGEKWTHIKRKARKIRKEGIQLSL